ncbi:MAG: acyl-CoA reductase [Bacteroidales bacterium]|nr:acyl-CoA reductase [Bacteroidales bacterium]
MKSKIINALSELSPILNSPNEKLIEAIELSVMENTWFDRDSVCLALKALAKWLNKEVLEEFCERYDFTDNPKTVAVICAGNIPAVNFHDLLCVLLSGNRALLKLSSLDNRLIPAIVEELVAIEPLIKDRVSFADGKINDFDAVIATGSNNTSRYFNYYFSKYPHIIRHSRSSIAVIQNNKIDYKGLMADILTHKGMGCRNISKIFVPKGFDFSELIEASLDYKYLLDHNKYRNNYDYHKAIFIMNNVPFVDSQVLILFENKDLFSPVSILNYEFYDSLNDIENRIELEKDNIQCIVSDIESIGGIKTINFGKAQQPEINDYADNIDTMLFLNSLN